MAGRLQKEHVTVDDNGVIVMSYPRAMAISEGSWLQIGDVSNYVTYIYGSTGTLMVEPRHDGRLVLATNENRAGVEVQIPPAPDHRQTASAHFVHGLTSGEPFDPLCQGRLCRDAQEILAAGLLSARRGREVSLPLRCNE